MEKLFQFNLHRSTIGNNDYITLLFKALKGMCEQECIEQIVGYPVQLYLEERLCEWGQCITLVFPTILLLTSLSKPACGPELVH